MNPYKGINAHLNSLLQTPGTSWAPFHQMHITFLVQFLNRVLPGNYRAVPEKSLQIKVDDDLQSRPRPDVTVFRRYETETSSAAVAMQPTWTVELAEEITPEEMYPAVVIRQADDPLMGKIVTRIELLSPSNKRGGSGFTLYKLRRTEAIQTGTPLVEIDYLHETRSLIENAPVYPADEGARPYTITVTDPRPDPSTGQIKGYAVSVNMPLPTVPIPLQGEEIANFDFDEVYQYTIGEEPWLSIMQNQMDMTQPPPRFETYSDADQKRIKQVMAQP